MRLLHVKCVRNFLNKSDVLNEFERIILSLPERYASRAAAVGRFGLDEMLMNAFYDAHPERRAWERDFKNTALDKHEIIVVKAFHDEATGSIALSVEDSHGSFPPELAYEYASNVTIHLRDWTIVPRTGDEERGAGIGLKLLQLKVERLSIKVREGESTEVCARLNARELPRRDGQRSFYFHHVSNYFDEITIDVDGPTDGGAKNAPSPSSPSVADAATRVAA